MNGIISLCHFCEQHGPSIVFCTQAFHTPDPQPLTPTDDSGRPTCYYIRDQDRFGPGALGCMPIAGETASAPTSPTSPTAPSSKKPSQFCEACRSIAPGQSGFISNDHDAKVSYVSNQFPDHPEVFSMMRQACVRSLSCEVCPGREGPMFFGDDHRGHVFSHTFFVKDSQARGFQRWFSIIVVMMDKVFLLNSWPFLVKHCRYIIHELQRKADVVYTEEQHKCPQRALRLNSRMRMTPENFRQQRGGNPRSLVVLTADRGVFRKLHRGFTWILKAGGCRLTERLLEGPPTEDSVIDWEKQEHEEETEEGFVKIFAKKVSIGDTSPEPDGSYCDFEEENSDVEDDVLPGPVIHDLRDLMQLLGQNAFHDLAHHIIIGNQAIVRGSVRSLMRSVIDCLIEILPRGCSKVIHYSDTYEDSWRCNFLGLNHITPLPDHVGLYVLLNIDVMLEGGNRAEAMPPSDLSDYSFTTYSPVTLTDKCPLILTKMEEALLQTNLSMKVVDQCFVCLKEEWMNKVKVLFKFTKAGGQRSEEDTRRLLTVVGAQQEDRTLLKFWMTGLSVHYKNHMLSSAVSHTVAK